MTRYSQQLARKMLLWISRIVLQIVYYSLLKKAFVIKQVLLQKGLLYTSKMPCFLVPF